MALIHIVLLHGLILLNLDSCLLFLFLRILDPALFANIKTDHARAKQSNIVRWCDMERNTRLRESQQIGGELGFEVAAEDGVTLFRCSDVQHHPIVPHSRHADRLDRDQRYLALQGGLHATILGSRNHEVHCFLGLRKASA
jgi:hypothetical protein